MKKLSLSVLALLFAGASVFAVNHTPAKKAKAAVCHTCSKTKCTKKAGCPNPDECGCN